MKVKIFVNIQIAKSVEYLKLNNKKTVIYPANECLNANNRLHFNIYEQDKFHAQLS